MRQIQFIFYLLIFSVSFIHGAQIVFKSDFQLQAYQQFQKSIDDFGQFSKLKCSSCKKVFESARSIISGDKSQQIGLNVSIAICRAFKLQSDSVCGQLIPSFGEMLRDVLKNQLFNAEYACASMALCQSSVSYPAIPPIDPDLKISSAFTSQSRRDYKFLHLSDWHIDLKYQEGMEADCLDAICCRPPHGPRSVSNSTVRKPAGKYGDFKCDTPIETSKEVIRKAFTTYQYDFVIMTGDQPPHDLWSETKQSVQRAEQFVSDSLFNATYQNDISVFMTIGNHDNSEVNQFPTLDINDTDVSWLYESLAEQWKPWFNDQQAYESMRKFGYYHQELTEKNLKIISLNTNHGYLLNWYTFLNRESPVYTYDPDGMFSYLIEELYKSELQGQKVFIIGHIPPGTADSNRFYGEIMTQITIRFRDTIAGQFFGHSHKDEFKIVYAEEDQQDPVSVIFMGPSITTFTKLNPSFRVYHLSPEHNLIDHKTFIMNLTQSNLLKEPIWEIEYSARQAYNFKTEFLSPLIWHNLTTQMEQSLSNKLEDNESLKLYLQLKYKRVQENVKECNKKCQKKTICSIRTSINYNTCSFKKQKSTITVMEKEQQLLEFSSC